MEVFAQTGSEGYDLYGLSKQQVIDDVLDHYEAHLGFLTYTHEHDYASVLTPATTVPTATGTLVQVPSEDTAAEVAEDAEEIRNHLDRSDQQADERKETRETTAARRTSRRSSPGGGDEAVQVGLQLDP